MTSQPPQTWDTLPDDPADIPFPIMVGWDDHCVTATAHDVQRVEVWRSKAVPPDWWMPWPTFPTDPMTVDAWHPMEMLPDNHPEWVCIKYANGGVERKRGTIRKYDAENGRERWCSVAAQMATTDANTAAAEAARGEG